MVSTGRTKIGPGSVCLPQAQLQAQNPYGPQRLDHTHSNQKKLEALALALPQNK